MDRSNLLENIRLGHRRFQLRHGLNTRRRFPNSQVREESEFPEILAARIRHLFKSAEFQFPQVGHALQRPVLDAGIGDPCVVGNVEGFQTSQLRQMLYREIVQVVERQF